MNTLADASKVLEDALAEFSAVLEFAEPAHAPASALPDWLEKGYCGARWMRVDLHLHTPGVRSFRCPPGLDPINNSEHKKQIIEQYVEQLVQQGIQVAAITDYQGIRPEWFEPIREKAQARGIWVYPGAELSFSRLVGGKHGLHILAIFPYDMDISGIQNTILSLDRTPLKPLILEDGSHRDIRSKEALIEALKWLRDQLQPLLIVAHPNDSSGLFKSYEPEPAAKFLMEVCPEGIEGLKEKDRQRLCSAGLPDKQCRRLAVVEFSDPRHIEEIGTKQRPDGTPRATWLKLSAPGDLQALRLALRDPEILVRTGTRPELQHSMRLLGLEIDGTGFLEGLKLALSPEQNILIGGRGVGKSAILETVRYILDITPYAPTEERERLVRHALGSGGKGILYAEKVVQGRPRYYRIERVWGEPPRVFELGPERRVELSPQQILGEEAPLFFGQKEIYEVTRNEKLRLQLLDVLIGNQAREQIGRIQKLEESLRENAGQIMKRQAALSERDEIEQRLKQIDHELELYRRAGVAEKLKEATALAADEQRLQQAGEELGKALGEWGEQRESWTERWRQQARQLAAGESRCRDILEEARKVFGDLEGRFETLFDEGEKALLQAQQEMANLQARWQQAREALEEDIRRIKQELGREALDPEILIRLTEERERLEPRRRGFLQIEAELQQLRDKRASLLEELQDARRKAWELRRQQAEAINDRLERRVRIEVIYMGNREIFAERLTELLRGSGVDRESIQRMRAAEDLNGYAIAQAVRQGTDDLQKYGLTSRRAQQVREFLLRNEDRLLEMELLVPEDAVRVYLKMLGDGEQPLEKLSVGEKATAMILVLLAGQERMFIVDQPEDDLDNRFVYEDIVQILRAQKGRRQVLAATHNPNIPVLGHAELVVALEAREEKARIRAQGALDREEVRDAIKQVMEGGEEAFRRRAEKYGWI